VLCGLNSAQNPWTWTATTYGIGTDSVQWAIDWGSDSLINGENFVLAVALESDVATTNSTNVGSTFAGNLMVYPIYRIGQPPTGVEEQGASVPGVFALLQNYPNPFNPTTAIEFTLAENSKVSLKVYDLLGREVAVLVNGEMKAGILHRVPFDGSKLASGIYFYRLEAGKNVQVKKLMLVK
jgi:hypothetical protein